MVRSTRPAEAVAELGPFRSLGTNVAGILPKLWRLQLVACVLGMVAGLVPGISFTGRFTGMDYMSAGFGVAAEDQRVRVTQVESGSPADRTGFRRGDIIQKPDSIEAVEAALDTVRRGVGQSFTVKRGETELLIRVAPIPPQLAAIWYAHPWYPIAGTLSLGLALLVFATSPLVPAPLWRSVVVGSAGLAMAAGFGFALVDGSVFSRLRIYQRWPMGTGSEWYFQQGLVGLAACVLLATLAAAEIRQRLTSPQESDERLRFAPKLQKAEPGGAGDGAPATPSVNPGAMQGPPSAS